jgi:hypothetical protein
MKTEANGRRFCGVMEAQSKLFPRIDAFDRAEIDRGEKLHLTSPCTISLLLQ